MRAYDLLFTGGIFRCHPIKERPHAVMNFPVEINDGQSDDQIIYYMAKEKKSTETTIIERKNFSIDFRLYWLPQIEKMNMKEL